MLDLATKVRRLKLKFGSRIDLVALLHNRLPFLEHLDLFQCSLAPLTTAVPTTRNMTVLHHLHSLSLENCTNVTDELVLVLVGLCPCLSDLSISCVVGKTEESMSVPNFAVLDVC